MLQTCFWCFCDISCFVVDALPEVGIWEFWIQHPGSREANFRIMRLDNRWILFCLRTSITVLFGSCSGGTVGYDTRPCIKYVWYFWSRLVFIPTAIFHINNFTHCKSTCRAAGISVIFFRYGINFQLSVENQTGRTSKATHAFRTSAFRACCVF